VCPDSEQTPMICQDQCMQASCSLHPEAICVMDVCNDCRPSFYRYALYTLITIQEKEALPMQGGKYNWYLFDETHTALQGRKCDVKRNVNSYLQTLDCAERLFSVIPTILRAISARNSFTGDVRGMTIILRA